MNKMKLIIDVPGQEAFDNDVSSVVIEAADGRYGIYPNKSPAVISLASGPVDIVMPDGTEKIGAAGSGICVVKENTVHLTIADFVWQEDIDKERQIASIQRLKDKLGKKDDMLHREFVLSQAALARAEARLEALSIKK